jgi:hypothetical protein
MVTNTSVSLVTNISIWDLAMSGWSVIHSGWTVFMDGKEVTLIGEPMPSAMIVSEKMPMGMCSQGMTGRGTNIETLIGVLESVNYQPFFLSVDRENGFLFTLKLHLTGNKGAVTRQ